MKRSEMLSHIRSEIRVMQSSVGLYSEGKLSYDVLADKLSKMILSTCETRGMLPPRAKLPGMDFSDNYWENED